jgi:hypothetical protein
MSLTDCEISKRNILLCHNYHTDVSKITGYTTAHAVSWLPHTIQAQVHFQASPCGT